MCGILGMIGNVPKEHVGLAHNILLNLFIMNKSRGVHAAGFSALHVRDNGKLVTEKRAISPCLFVQRSLKFKSLEKDFPNIFIGHTRHSTSGTPKRGRNNHPFNSSRYSMVHNGSVPSWMEIAKDKNITLRSETDSEIILGLLEEKDGFHKGIQNVMKSIRPHSRVAVATLQHNENPRLFIFRNHYNPVYLMTFPSLRAIFFSSEGVHIKYALKGIWGNDYEDNIRKNEIEIKQVPEWASMEFVSTVKGPTLVQKKKISRESTYSSNIITGASSSIKTCYEIKREKLLPVKTKNSEISEMSTKELLDNASLPTHIRALALTKEIREASKVIRIINNNAFIQHEEIEHWKKWMLDV